jgi:hypothetical protein
MAWRTLSPRKNVDVLPLTVTETLSFIVHIRTTIIANMGAGVKGDLIGVFVAEEINPTTDVTGHGQIRLTGA